MEHKGNIDILNSSNQSIDDSSSKVFSDNKQKGNIHIIDETKEMTEETSLKETLEKHVGDKGVPGNLKSSKNDKSSYEYACNESSKVNQDLDCQEKTADESKTSQQNRNDNAEQCYCETQTYYDSNDEKVKIITGSLANSDDNERCNEEPVETLKEGLSSIFITGNGASSQNNYRPFNPSDSKQKVYNNMASAGDSPDCENKSATSVEKTSDDCKDFCDFCDNISRFICTSCKYFYCEKCLNQLHPAVGPFRSHKIVPVDDEIRIEHEKCAEHGLLVQLYCTYCEQKRCPECASTKCNLHFKDRNCDIQREKTVLVEELEKATSKLAFVEKYKDAVQNELDKTALTGLYRREQIRQEFLSFHDLLLQKEEKLLIQLEQDVQERTSHIRDTLQTRVASLEREDAKLTAAVIELVQSADDETFIEERVKAKDLCQQVDIRIKEFDKTWAKNSTYKCSRLLDNHFSMFFEKKQLSDELDEIVGEESQLVFRQKTLYIDDISRPLQIMDYLQEPKIPTSTEVRYIVQAFVRGELVYETDTKNLQDIQLNTRSTLIFNGGNRFLLKVTPVFKCFLSIQKHQSREGQPAYMFIVVAYLFQAEKTDTCTKAYIHARRKSSAQREIYDCQVLKTLVRRNNTCEISKELVMAKGAGISKELDMTNEAEISKELVMAKGAGISKELVMTNISQAKETEQEKRCSDIQNTTRYMKKAVRKIRR